MPRTAKSFIAPAYLLACLILGGSAQGVWQNMGLQLAGLGIIAWAAANGDELLPKTAKPLLWTLIAAVAVVVVQLVPLPPSIWAHGMRARIGDGYALLGTPLPMLPLSVTPYDSLNALLGLIPPLALFCAILRLGAHRASWLAAGLLAGAVAGIILGALQVASHGLVSPWYLYPQTNRGLGVGFFANANHMADLLVVALPFVAALAAAGRSRNVQRYSALLAVLAAVALLLIVGIALNGSLAGYALAVPVIAASLLIVSSSARNLRVPIAVAAGLAMLAAVAALASTSIGSATIGQDASSSVQSREQILNTTGQAIGDTMPFGSGLGSFVKVYPIYESADRVTPEYVIHAHNDYAEVALELGVPGILLMLVFLGWWAAAARAAWQTGGGSPYARAASIASAAILVHSLVDFPLRTAGIGATFAMCLALMIDRRPQQRHEPNDLRPARHLIVT
ncbi:O-antigen ligase family protein [Sphingomonas sp.]|uniref:O-antigen ligase family protein n=1 Tax=Sphingomonas sp. TaxID=28214 RepID=UPI0038A72767